MGIHWRAVEQYFTVVLFVFEFYPAYSFSKFINLGLGTDRSERVFGTTARTNMSVD